MKAGIGKGAVGGAAVAFLIESGDLFHGPRAAGLGSVPVPGQRQRQVGTAGVHLAAVANGGGTLGIALCSTCVIIVYGLLPILQRIFAAIAADVIQVGMSHLLQLFQRGFLNQLHNEGRRMRYIRRVRVFSSAQGNQFGRHAAKVGNTTPLLIRV